MGIGIRITRIIAVQTTSRPEKCAVAGPWLSFPVGPTDISSAPGPTMHDKGQESPESLVPCDDLHGGSKPSRLPESKGNSADGFVERSLVADLWCLEGESLKERPR